MKLPPFDYACPATIPEAVQLLASHDDAKAIAGGQSLMPMLAFRLAHPTLLVDLRRLGELRGIRISDRGVVLGAMVRWRDILADARLATAHPLLKAAVRSGTLSDRNRGTVGGSIAHADPAAEMPGIVMTCDAEIAVVGKSGARVIQAADFFQGPLMTALTSDEIITEIRLPAWPARRRWGFQGSPAAAAISPWQARRVLRPGRERPRAQRSCGRHRRRRPAAAPRRRGRRAQRTSGRRGDDREGRGGRVGHGRSARRHPCERRLSARAGRHHGRARAQERRCPRATLNIPVTPCQSASKSTANRSRSRSSRG